MNTTLGRFHQDLSGLWHYTVNGLEIKSIEVYIADALAHRPKDQPAWFWFRNMPTPIHINDSAERLYTRYLMWAGAFEREKGLLPLTRLQKMKDAEMRTGVGSDPTYG